MRYFLVFLENKSIGNGVTNSFLSDGQYECTKEQYMNMHDYQLVGNKICKISDLNEELENGKLADESD